jgi:hypothetical protein
MAVSIDISEIGSGWQQPAHPQNPIAEHERDM